MTLHDRGRLNEMLQERVAELASEELPWRPGYVPVTNGMTVNTIPELLRDAASKYGDRLALRQPAGKDVHTWTWSQYLEAAEEIAAGLHALGIGKGDHVALCSETRAEFYLADQGILMNGSVAAALYPSYPPEELKRTIAMADAKALFVEDPKTFAKLKDAPVAHFILLTGEARGRDFARRTARAWPRSRHTPRRCRAGRQRHPLSDFRRDRRTEDGDGDARRHCRQHPYGTGGAAADARRHHDRVPALGAHRAARGGGDAADSERHAPSRLPKACSSCSTRSKPCGPPSSSRRRASGSASIPASARRF